MKLQYIFASLVFACACSNSSNTQQTKQTVTAPKQLNVKLENGNRYTCGNTITINISTADNSAIDSAIAYLDKTKTTIKNSNTIVIKTNDNSVGKKTIRVEATLKDGTKAEGKTRVTLLSDIEPTLYTYKVIKRIPHNTKYYTQGLEFDNDTLYEGTGLEGRSALYKIDFNKQSIINTTNLNNEHFGEGITIMGNKVYQLTWRSSIGFIYNKSNLNKIGSFNYYTEGWGLTNDGKNLIMSDGSEKIYYIDTTSLQEIKQIEVYDNQGAITLLNELEYVDGLIYANIYQSDFIIAFDPTNGKVTKIIDMRNLLDITKLSTHVDVLNGIAYHKAKKQWYVTGKLWPTMFLVEFVEK